METSFVEGFGRCSDPTSLLRLAGIPFVGLDVDGRPLHLLRVVTESLTDVGAVSPLLGGGGVRYDPMPARMVSQRRSLVFVCHGGSMVARPGLRRGPSALGREHIVADRPRPRRLTEGTTL